MKKLIAAGLIAGGVLVPFSGVAAAGPADNPTTRDAWGFCVTNHIQNHNGDNNGIGHLRSVSKGSVSDIAGNRAPAVCTEAQS